MIGGGTAGTIAAIQAGRAGASTLLVEKNGMLGGTMTIGGINHPAHFFAWGNQVIGGIGWELFCRTCAETGRPVPKPSGRSRHHRINAAIFACVADEAVLAAGADVLFHAMPAAVQFTDGAWTLQVCTKTGLRTCRAKVLIDATGDANVVGLAGLELIRPDIVQPATLTFGCSGYAPDALDYEALKTASDTTPRQRCGVDYLLTWNCRHINNAATKPIVRSICAVAGYTCPEICTPLELLSEEETDDV